MSSVHVITGPMFSGKTEELLRLVRRASIGGKIVQVFRPATDTRGALVESRSGAIASGLAVNSSQSILDVSIAGTVDVVAIDEAQFFDNELAQVVDELATEYGKDVLVSGLDRDFRGAGFGSMPRLLTIADYVTKLTAVCTYRLCGKDASMTQRLIAGQPARWDMEQVLIEGETLATYEARCRRHHDMS